MTLKLALGVCKLLLWLFLLRMLLRLRCRMTTLPFLSTLRFIGAHIFIALCCDNAQIFQ